jgi:hypothetical protein
MNINIFRCFLCEQETKIIKRFLFGFWCLVFVLVIVSMEPMAYGADGLVLWNGLGSDEEVLNSFVGPNLEFFTGGGGIHVQGDRDYVAGYDGNGVTLKGSYFNMARVHNIVLNNLGNYIDTEKGCIELWYFQTESPVAYHHGIYRLFGGSYGLGSGIAFQAQNAWGGIPARITFALSFGVPACFVWYDLANIPNDEWIHLAASWDRKGIDGTTETIRLYVNNVVVATTNNNHWGTIVGQRVDICGGNDEYVSGKFKMDELKIWDYAKTNFFSNPSTIDIDPDKLNLESKGKWVTGYIELPGEFLIDDIDIETVAIAKINENTIDLLYREGPADIGDYDGDDIQDLMVKFDRPELIALLKNMNAQDGDEIDLTVSGKLTGGESFEGSCTITVINKGKK